MLKVRLVGVLAVKDGIVVQSINFRRFLPVGRPEIAVDYLNRWGIDEIVLIDIRATLAGRAPDAAGIRAVSRHAQVPFAVGGGITALHDIEQIIRSGADKVVLNTSVVDRPALLTEGAQAFGAQCMVAAIDARRTERGFEAFTRSGTVGTGRTPRDLARTAQDLGAGEILLTSIDCDGAKTGYDEELVTSVIDAVQIPVIICGGVGRASHLARGVRAGASAVAAANFFHYTEHSAAAAKRVMRTLGAEVRLDTLVSYDGVPFDIVDRPMRPSDAVLDQLRFEHVPEEVI